MRKLSILLILVLAITTPAAAIPAKVSGKKPTRSEVRAELQSNGERQELVHTTLSRLQRLKTNHIVKTKLATPNDKSVAIIYDRLISAVESRYKSGDLADFLTRYTLQMAETEKSNNSNLTAFFSYLGDVIKSAKNDRADIIATIENYVRSAPVAEPLSAVRFILNNSYSNGRSYEAAIGFAREDAAPDNEASTVVGPAEPVAILPPLELPQLLPPMPDAPALESEAQTEATLNKVDRTNELVPEKTPVLETTTPLIDSSAPSVPPVANTLSASSQAEYSASGQKPTLELPPKTE